MKKHENMTPLQQNTQSLPVTTKGLKPEAQRETEKSKKLTWWWFEGRRGCRDETKELLKRQDYCFTRNQRQVWFKKKKSYMNHWWKEIKEGPRQEALSLACLHACASSCLLNPSSCSATPLHNSCVDGADSSGIRCAPSSRLPLKPRCCDSYRYFHRAASLSGPDRREPFPYKRK